MPPNKAKNTETKSTSSTHGKKTPSSLGQSEMESLGSPRNVQITLTIKGQTPGLEEYIFLLVFNGTVLFNCKWPIDFPIELQDLPFNLNNTYYRDLIADKPLILLLRATGDKGSQESDPLLNSYNRAGACIDLLPLLLGEEELNITVPLVLIVPVNNSITTNCTIHFFAESPGATDIGKVPLTITMISANCLPLAKEGTVYIGAVCLDGLTDPVAVNFEMSLGTSFDKNLIWATASNLGQAARTFINISCEDMFVPQGFEPQSSDSCINFYWNAIKRVLVNPTLLLDRLSKPLLVEFAGVAKIGKADIRGRYMGFLDIKALTVPGMFSLTACTKLLFYSESNLPENIRPLLEVPPSSAKASAPETDLIVDEHGHNSYVILRFDLTEPLVPRMKLANFYDIVGLTVPEGPAIPVEELHVEPPPEDSTIDVRRIRKECGALAVHKELSSIACRGVVQMNQSIKKTAAIRLLMRVRGMLKQFSPGECSNIELQDIITGQHASCRRAVTASFAPQPPPVKIPARAAAAKARMAGDNRIADIHTETNLTVNPSHSRSLLSKALRCLEERNDSIALTYIDKSLKLQPRNRYLLWIFSGQNFDKGEEGFNKATAALHIAVKGDYSDGTSNAIGYAALHGLYHYGLDEYSAFVAAKKMRKFYELKKEWRKFLLRWLETSGEEEVFWTPSALATDNPILIASAFFLCLRCYKFSEFLLRCVENGCTSRGSHLKIKLKVSPDVYYIQVASLLLRRQLDNALKIAEKGIRRFGHSPIMSEIKTTCLNCINGWGDQCEMAMAEAERSGSEISPSLLLRAAIGGLHGNPEQALQRAARAHKMSPSAYSALVIGRSYEKLGERSLARCWAAASVRTEPLLADGWAFLSLLAMYDREVDKARHMLRTARQVGPLSPDLENEVQKFGELIELEVLSFSLVNDLCLCEY